MSDEFNARGFPSGRRYMNITLKPWITPNFVIGETPPRTRQEGFNPDAAPKWALKEVDAETLAKMCDDFRAEIFRKAEKPDPAGEPAKHPDPSKILLPLSDKLAGG